MAKVLKVGEMLRALELLRSPRARRIRAAVEAAAELAADELAAAAGLVRGRLGDEDGDYLVPFRLPAGEAAEAPPGPVLDLVGAYDPEGEWEPEAPPGQEAVWAAMELYKNAAASGGRVAKLEAEVERLRKKVRGKGAPR